MTLAAGTRLGPYEILANSGPADPPPFALAIGRELRRGLAVAKREGRNETGR